jgi:hypothetical protein
MEDKPPAEKRPDPQRVEALKNLPSKITGSLTKEEIKAFLLADEWPDSLREKLKDYLKDEE